MVYVFAVAVRSIGGGGDFFVSALRSSGSKLPRHRFPPPPVLLYHWLFLTMRLGILGPLRGPAGINPLATKGSGDLSPHHKSGWGIGWDLR
jgi:hypothetical protein